MTVAESHTHSSITLTNVWKYYNGVAVLKGLSLSIPSNATTVILGRSGAGKSVTLRLILGTEIPDNGTVVIDGMDINSLPSHKKDEFATGKIGMLFQSSALFDSMTVKDNISFTLDNLAQHKALSSKEKDEIVADALQKVALAGFEKKYPSELSGGQKRRAALARLIVYKPKILLFDEPTTGLDPVTAMQINELIAQTQKTLQATCIVVTHDLISALHIGTYFTLHNDGIITATGYKETFFKMDDPFLRVFINSAIVPKDDTTLLA